MSAFDDYVYERVKISKQFFEDYMKATKEMQTAIENDKEIRTLNDIFRVAVDEGFSEREALWAVVEIVENRLAEFGLFPEGRDPNEG